MIVTPWRAFSMVVAFGVLSAGCTTVGPALASPASTRPPLQESVTPPPPFPYRADVRALPLAERLRTYESYKLSASPLGVGIGPRCYSLDDTAVYLKASGAPDLAAWREWPNQRGWWRGVADAASFVFVAAVVGAGWDHWYNDRLQPQWLIPIAVSAGIGVGAGTIEHGGEPQPPIEAFNARLRLKLGL